jgi:8-oxo-dGTP pyrophosphatase MutT (NUDIX family)|tara:strand:+ start:3073 stop:3864 length:792 start_codon:yes stop_codon:yes gene_type:complete
MTDNAVVTPVPAATILMLRDGEQGLEVFMVVRHRQIDFASGALVFPGGKVDAGDRDVRAYCSGVDELDDVGLSLHVAAIREAFEECGILLARQVDSDGLITGEKLQSLHHYRERLNKGELSIKEFLSSEGLVLACDLLSHFAHWITPAMMPKRFDTHFYLAIAPDDHLAIHDGYESVDSVWITPQQAILDAEEGRKTIIFPTRLNVEMLGLSTGVDDAIKAAAERQIVTVLPWTEQRDDGTYLCIPAEAGYSVSEELTQGRPA